MKKPLLSQFILPVLLLILVACGESPQETNPPEPIGGLDPEAIIRVSGQDWTPATIGVIFRDEGDEKVIYVGANSSANRGFQRNFNVRIYDEDLSLDANGGLDYWVVESPATGSVDYLQYTDGINRFYNSWSSQSIEHVGIRVDSLYSEEAVTYASGEFFANPANPQESPRVQEITGVFHNVRVFSTHADMQVYFQRVTALEDYAN